VAVVVPALLGLLGLMLAFSFGSVDRRFDERRALVLQDANAIGTTYLRAKLLPAPHAARAQKMVREYGTLRIMPSA
jgi:hypothetical protein